MNRQNIEWMPPWLKAVETLAIDTGTASATVRLAPDNAYNVMQLEHHKIPDAWLPDAWLRKGGEDWFRVPRAGEWYLSTKGVRLLESDLSFGALLTDNYGSNQYGHDNRRIILEPVTAERTLEDRVTELERRIRRGVEGQSVK
jgi:hypothetical protein